MAHESLKEVLVPASHLHFGVNRSLDRIAAQVIESHASDQDEIARSVLIASEDVVFTESDVEQPMLVVLDHQ